MSEVALTGDGFEAAGTEVLELWLFENDSASLSIMLWPVCVTSGVLGKLCVVSVALFGFLSRSSRNRCVSAGGSEAAGD